MPLAAVAASFLLLLGLSLQAMALQERARSGAHERLRREEDLLTTAAHLVVAALNGSHSCLLVLPLERWHAEEAACASPAVVETLTRLEVWSAPVQVLGWRPGADGGSAELEVQLAAGEGRAPRRGRFEVGLAGTPPQAVALRLRNWGGALP
ncbi:MAG: hypothetical protein RLZZ117_2125 [Cyanobacteriota bacterium]|jgi:hypothetical protein